LPALDELNSRLGYLAREPSSPPPGILACRPCSVRRGDVLFDVERRSKPPEVVHLCDDGPCHAMGAAGVRGAMEKAGLEVRRTSCIGQCGCGPVVVTGDGALYRYVTPRGIRAILDGQPPQPFRSPMRSWALSWTTCHIR